MALIMKPAVFISPREYLDLNPFFNIKVWYNENMDMTALSICWMKYPTRFICYVEGHLDLYEYNEIMNMKIMLRPLKDVEY